MSNSLSELEDLLELTPEDMEMQRILDEQQEMKRQIKIKQAVTEENLEFSIREYDKVTESEKFRQKITLFIGTKKGIYDVPDTLGRMEFTLYENVNLEDVYIAAKKEGRNIFGEMGKLLHIDIIAIYSDYRGYGLSEKLVSYFFDLYQKDYSNFPISIEFMNPIAEYTVQKVLKTKGMKKALKKELIQRYYE